ncbi:MAG TPA: SgcJ/EcaC family oxidoreductase [Longimicrobiaceae bacterium]|nr:SgcJ/EcaC family oxidoreductase [Longimicrobiaceae bacterium]
MNRLFAFTAAVVLSLTLAPRLAAQRDLFGMGGAGASEVRRQFEAEARTQVSALLVDYQSAWGSRNLASLVKLYARDATVYPAGGSMLAGRDAVRDWFRGFLPKVERLQARMMEFRVSGDLAYTTLQVSYVLHDGDTARPVAATDVVVLRRSAVGAWSIVSHLSRPEAPAAAESAQ